MPKKKWPDASRGSQGFDAFCVEHGLNHADAAKALSVSAVTILEWRRGSKVPSDVNQDRISVWTNGAVCPDMWPAREALPPVVPLDSGTLPTADAPKPTGSDS